MHVSHKHHHTHRIIYCLASVYIPLASNPADAQQLAAEQPDGSKDSGCGCGCFGGHEEHAQPFRPTKTGESSKELKPAADLLAAEMNQLSIQEMSKTREAIFLLWYTSSKAISDDV